MNERVRGRRLKGNDDAISEEQKRISLFGGELQRRGLVVLDKVERKKKIPKSGERRVPDRRSQNFNRKAVVRPERGGNEKGGSPYH